MDGAVEDDGEVDVAVVVHVEVEPVEEEDGRVVVDVEERELLPLLADDDEERVDEVEHLRGVEEPEHVGHGRVLGVVGVADQVEVRPLRDDDGLDAHVRAEHDLRDVVEEGDAVELDAVAGVGAHDELRRGGRFFWRFRERVPDAAAARIRRARTRGTRPRC